MFEKLICINKIKKLHYIYKLTVPVSYSGKIQDL